MSLSHTVALICLLYLVFEAIAVPFGHTLGKRVSALRILLILAATALVLFVGYQTVIASH